MLAASAIIFAIKAKAQSGTFDHVLLKDRWGEELREMDCKIQLLPGKLRITESRETWDEKILLQSKSPDTCQVETSAGYYLLILERGCLKKAYLRSNVGADRIYLSGAAEIFEPRN